MAWHKSIALHTIGTANLPLHCEQASDGDQGSQQPSPASKTDALEGSGLVLHLAVPLKPKKGAPRVAEEFPELTLPKNQQRIAKLRQIKQRTDMEALAEKQAAAEERAQKQARWRMQDVSIPEPCPFAFASLPDVSQISASDPICTHLGIEFCPCRRDISQLSRGSSQVYEHCILHQFLA